MADDEPTRSIQHNTPPFVLGGAVVGFASFAYLTVDLGGFDQGCALLAVAMGTHLLVDDFRIWRWRRKHPDAAPADSSDENED